MDDTLINQRFKTCGKVTLDMRFCVWALGTFFVSLPVFAEIINIDNAELLRLQAKGVPVIDVRTQEEWRDTGVIKGARLITFSFAGSFDKAAWLKQEQQLVKPGEPVVLICRSGRRSKAVADYLESQSVKGTIYNASGGMDSWKREGRSVVAP
ncbi:MAG: rhodanese-like domain-containing protein [Fluviibacter sp.]